MSWARDEGDRPRRPSQFLLEALDAPAVGTDVLRPSPIEKIERLRPPAATKPCLPAPRAASGAGRAATEPELRPGQRLHRVPGPVSVRAPHPAAHAGRHALVVGKALHAAVQAYHRSQIDGALTREALQAELDRHWESTGFVTRAHEDARRTSAQAALVRFWDEQQADPSPVIGVEQEFAFRFGPDRVRGRMDRVDRRPDGSMAGGLQVRRRPRPGHRRPPIANRSSWPSTPWAGRRSTAVRRTTSRSTSSSRARWGTARRRRFASTRRGPDRGDGRRGSRGTSPPAPDRCAARLARSARSALTRPVIRRDRILVVAFFFAGSRPLVGVVVAVASQLSPRRRPAIRALRPTGILIVVGLGTIGGIALMTGTAFLIGLPFIDGSSTSGHGPVPLRRGALAILAALAGLRLVDALSAFSALVVIAVALAAEWLASRRLDSRDRRGRGQPGETVLPEIHSAASRPTRRAGRDLRPRARPGLGRLRVLPRAHSTRARAGARSRLRLRPPVRRVPRRQREPGRRRGRLRGHASARRRPRLRRSPPDGRRGGRTHRARPRRRADGPAQERFGLIVAPASCPISTGPRTRRGSSAGRRGCSRPPRPRRSRSHGAPHRRSAPRHGLGPRLGGRTFTRRSQLTRRVAPEGLRVTLSDRGRPGPRWYDSAASGQFPPLVPLS